MKRYEDNDEYPGGEPLLISTCCGAKSIGELQYDAYGHATGICSCCRDHANFEQEPEKE